MPSGEFSGGLTLTMDDRSQAWDQFAANCQVPSTYKEELYTTPLDVATIPQAVKEKAEMIAREIEASQAPGTDEAAGEDEEEMFGAVRGTGAYKKDVVGSHPPQQKKPSDNVG